MSALTTEDLEERFLVLASPVLTEFEKQIASLFNEKFAEFSKQLEAKTVGSSSGFHKEKLSSLMDKLINNMVIIKDNFISQLTAKVNRAIVEAEERVDLTDPMMQSFIDDNSSSAVDEYITLFKEESNHVIIEGLGELSLEDNNEPQPEEDYDNSMSEDTGDMNNSESLQSDQSELELPESHSEQSDDVVVRMPTGDKDKKKRKSIKLTSMIRKKANKTNSGNYRPVPGMN